MERHNKEEITAYLTESLGEDKAKEVLSYRRFDYKILCSILPIICGEEEAPNDEFKLAVLSFNPWIFFRFGLAVDNIPDLRMVREETRRSIIMDEWNPWMALSEDLANLEEAGRRGDKNHRVVYRHLKRVGKRLLPPFYQKRDHIYYSTRIRATERSVGQFMKEFFATYPTLSFLLLSKSLNKKWAIAKDYPFVTLLSLGGVELGYAALTQRREVVDWILASADPIEVLKESREWIENRYVVEWLLDAEISETVLREDIATLDDVLLFIRVYDPRFFQEWFPLLLEKDSGKIIQYLFSTLPVDVIEELLPFLYERVARSPWSKAIAQLIAKNYGALRSYNGLDLLPLALIEGDIEWVKALVEAGEDLASPLGIREAEYIKYIRISPLLFVYEKGKGPNKRALIEYMLPLYNVEPEQLLYIAIVNSLYEAVEEMIDIHKFDKRVFRDALSMIPYEEISTKYYEMIMALLEGAELDPVLKETSPILPLRRERKK